MTGILGHWTEGWFGRRLCVHYFYVTDTGSLTPFRLFKLFAVFVPAWSIRTSRCCTNPYTFAITDHLGLPNQLITGTWAPTAPLPAVDRPFCSFIPACCRHERSERTFRRFTVSLGTTQSVLSEFTSRHEEVGRIKETWLTIGTFATQLWQSTAADRGLLAESTRYAGDFKCTRSRTGWL